MREAATDVPGLFDFVLNRLAGSVPFSTLAATSPTPEGGLSRRLRETLAGLLEGDSARQIALRLGLSHSTVREYVTALYRRLNVAGRAELTALFICRG